MALHCFFNFVCATFKSITSWRFLNMFKTRFFRIKWRCWSKWNGRFKENGSNKNATCILTFEMWVTNFWGKVGLQPLPARALACCRALLQRYPLGCSRFVLADRARPPCRLVARPNRTYPIRITNSITINLCVLYVTWQLCLIKNLIANVCQTWLVLNST